MNKFNKGMVNAVILSILKAIAAGDNKKAIAQCAKLANLARKLNVALNSVLTENCFKVIHKFIDAVFYQTDFEEVSVAVARLLLSLVIIFDDARGTCFLPSKI